MAELLHLTSLSRDGPWLLDYDRLESLDRAIDQEWEGLQDRRLKIIQAQAQERFDRELRRYPRARDEKELAELRIEAENQARADSHLRRETRQITIRFVSGKRLVVRTFKEARDDRSVDEELPVEFQLRLTCGVVECNLDVEERWSSTLTLKVSPETSNDGWELYATLRRWVQAVEAPLWQRVWRASNPFHWALLFMVFVVLFALANLGTPSPFQQQAHQLLAGGLTSGETTKAIELLLAMQSGYPSTDMPAKSFSWMYWTVGGLIVVGVVLTFPPQTCLGIGRGQRRIRFWLWWSRVISVTVPGLLMAVVFRPYLTRVILGP